MFLGCLEELLWALWHHGPVSLSGFLLVGLPMFGGRGLFSFLGVVLLVLIYRLEHVCYSIYGLIGDMLRYSFSH
jgi:hypothetical protein